MNSLPRAVLRLLPLAGLLSLPLTVQSGELSPARPADPVDHHVRASALPVEIAENRMEGMPPSCGKLSPGLLAMISATLPKYAPPADPAGRENADDDAENPVLRLPRYVVRGPRPLFFSERDISTRRGLTEIAEKRYITTLDRALNLLRFAVLAPSMESRALAMYDEDDRLKNMADLDHGARNARMADPAAGAELARLADATYQRTAEFGGIHGPN